jgi:hypothetical protein
MTCHFFLRVSSKTAIEKYDMQYGDSRLSENLDFMDSFMTAKYAFKANSTTLGSQERHPALKNICFRMSCPFIEIYCREKCRFPFIDNGYNTFMKTLKTRSEPAVATLELIKKEGRMVQTLLFSLMTEGAKDCRTFRKILPLIKQSGSGSRCTLYTALLQ